VVFAGSVGLVELGNADTELNASRESHLPGIAIWDSPWLSRSTISRTSGTGMLMPRRAGPKVQTTLLLHGFIKGRCSTPIIDGIDAEDARHLVDRQRVIHGDLLAVVLLYFA
jgi:hypothetical protein